MKKKPAKPTAAQRCRFCQSEFTPIAGDVANGDRLPFMCWRCSDSALVQFEADQARRRADEQQRNPWPFK